MKSNSSAFVIEWSIAKRTDQRDTGVDPKSVAEVGGFPGFENRVETDNNHGSTGIDDMGWADFSWFVAMRPSVFERTRKVPPTSENKVNMRSEITRTEPRSSFRKATRASCFVMILTYPLTDTR